MKQQTTLQKEIFGWLLLFVVLFVVVCSTVVWLMQSRLEHMQRFSGMLTDLHALLLSQNNTRSDFLYVDIINPRFFKTGTSATLELNNTISKREKHLIQQLRVATNSWLNDDCFRQTINDLQHDIYHNDKLFDSLTTMVYSRGFKDWGYEGKLRECIHMLEKSPELNTIKILQLRRREKDFIIRAEHSYIDSVVAIAGSIRHELLSSRSIDPERLDKLTSLLDCYLQNFKMMSDIDIRSGIKNSSGLSWHIRSNSLHIDSQVTKLLKLSKQRQQSFTLFLTVIFASIIIVAIVLSIIVSYHLSKKITSPLNQLASSIDLYTRNGFVSFSPITLGGATSDVMKLLENFTTMQNEMSSYINHFKKRVDERTREIEEQKNIITEQKQNLIDSINSAKMIQHSMLQDEHHISHIAPGCFVLYLPKDIVSGDFYYVDWKWDEQSMSETLYLLVGDATGHGVPGAFTSMLGLSIIKSLFEKTISPLELMITLNNVLYHHLHKNKKKKSLENFENMDIGLCCIDYKAMTLRFISANRPCYIIRQGQLLEIKRTFVGIGEDLNVEHKLCVKELDLQEGDTIYIFSDGYASQFGENENKKLNTKRFVEIITRASELDLPKQKSFLETSLRNWQHGTEQTDDIVLLGLKITRQT